eukprot:EG_transcript_11508
MPLSTANALTVNVQDLALVLRDASRAGVHDFYLDCWLAEAYATLRRTVREGRPAPQRDPRRYQGLALQPRSALWAEEGGSGESEVQEELWQCKGELAREAFAIPEAANADGTVSSPAYKRALKCVHQLSILPSSTGAPLAALFLGVLGNAAHLVADRLPNVPGARPATAHPLPGLLFLTDLYRVLLNLRSPAVHLLRQHGPHAPDPVLAVPSGAADTVHGYLPPAALLATRMCLTFSVAYDKLLAEVGRAAGALTAEYLQLLRHFALGPAAWRTTANRKRRKQKKKARGTALAGLKQPDGTSDCVQKVIDQLLTPLVQFGALLGTDSAFVLRPVLAHAVTAVAGQWCGHALATAGVAGPVAAVASEAEAGGGGGGPIGRQLGLDAAKLRAYISTLGPPSSDPLLGLPVWRQLAATVAAIAGAQGAPGPPP